MTQVATAEPAPDAWPPSFTLDQERVLNLLTGDRFYSNPSAALREAILNAIDATHRLGVTEPAVEPKIEVLFDRGDLTLRVSDCGVGMNQESVTQLFAKVGASASTAEVDKASVGEFGIGVISYFMACDTFELHTFDGLTQPIGLLFSRQMLAGGGATEIAPMRTTRGTTVVLKVRDEQIFTVLLDSYPHWCRDIDGAAATLIPEGRILQQGGSHRASAEVRLDLPRWIERAHLGPISDPTGWEGMPGISTVAVLYRGVFVQEFQVRQLWGIEGSIDVDPKHFKPRLNREGFIEGQFQAEVEAFLQTCHPRILEVMADRLALAVERGELTKWTEKRWANLWLSVPRHGAYQSTAATWDRIFRSLPAFEVATRKGWEPLSLERLTSFQGAIYVAPLAEDTPNDVVKAALRYLRNSGHFVIRGIRRDRAWMRYAPSAFGTTADLITQVFAEQLPPLTPIAPNAEEILAEIEVVAPLYTGPPTVDLVRIGVDSAPVLRLRERLVINIDHPLGVAIAADAIQNNGGALALIGITARHAYDQMTQVASVVKDAAPATEVLGPIRRRFIRSLLQ